jgi:DNA repair exonuclease SbcCD ATPase subunit
VSKHYISCARCDKDIEITTSSDCHSSDIDGQLLCYDCWQKEQPKYLADQIADLEAKLAESESSHEILINQFEEETEKLRRQIKQESDARKRFVEEVKSLKQQLAEKDDLIKQTIKFYSDDFVEKDKELKELRYIVKSKEQDKTSFAVEQLEKVKKYADIDYRKNCYIGAVELDKYIDQLIAEIKGE